MEYSDIQHDIINQLFFLRTGSGVARLRYTKPDRDVINLKETYVPTKNRGMGIGSALADQAITYAQNRNFEIETECPFVEKYMTEEMVSD